MNKKIGLGICSFCITVGFFGTTAASAEELRPDGTYCYILVGGTMCVEEPDPGAAQREAEYLKWKEETLDPSQSGVVVVLEDGTELSLEELATLPPQTTVSPTEETRTIIHEPIVLESPETDIGTPPIPAKVPRIETTTNVTATEPAVRQGNWQSNVIAIF